MSNRHTTKHTRIKSLQDLQLEKAKVRMEIMKKEEHIRSDYRHIIEALTFKNILSSLVEDISVQSTVISKAFAIGKSLFSKRKGKKKE